ncbi:MAG TPA: response regulator [Chloroflexota bacterium]|jgi:CheY-like chemotaxis protein|nr:response regulator [Chloroflexota bacterium]
MPAPEGTTLDILIVEDNPANLLLAGAVLRRAGHRIREARSAEEARERLEAGTPDVVLMDVQLPGEDGLSLTRWIKANPATAGVVIVALTAHAMAEDRARALAAGCDAYLAKPIDTRTLAREIVAIAATARAAEVER